MGPGGHRLPSHWSGVFAWSRGSQESIHPLRSAWRMTALVALKDAVSLQEPLWVGFSMSTGLWLSSPSRTLFISKLSTHPMKGQVTSGDLTRLKWNMAAPKRSSLIVLVGSSQTRRTGTQVLGQRELMRLAKLLIKTYKNSFTQISPL